MERIRAFAEIPFQIDFHQVGKRHLYQEIAVTALHLKQLGAHFLLPSYLGVVSKF